MSKSDSLAGVSAAANQPPPDIDALEARLAAALAERDTAIIERDAALRQNDRLAHLLRQLQRMQFGRRSEKLDPDQFALALEDIEQVVAAREAADDKQNKAAAAARVEKRRGSRGALPAHLPRVHSRSSPRTGTAHAADRRCMRSALMSRSGWTWSRRSSGCWGRTDPNMRAAPPRRRG